MKLLMYLLHAFGKSYVAFALRSVILRTVLT